MSIKLKKASTVTLQEALQMWFLIHTDANSYDIVM